jgi:hypothetical protein
MYKRLSSAAVSLAGRRPAQPAISSPACAKYRRAAWRRVLTGQRCELSREALEAEIDAERPLVLAKQLTHDLDVSRGSGFANRDGAYFDCSTR